MAPTPREQDIDAEASGSDTGDDDDRRASAHGTSGVSARDPVTARLEALVAEFALPESAVATLDRLLRLQAADDTASTSVRDRTAAVERHVADSLVAFSLPCVRKARLVADLGSGAGWPGFALAAGLPASRVALVESSVRRCRYLLRAAEGAGALNVTVAHARAEEWSPGRDRHDLVTARALASLPVVLEYAAPLLAPGGYVVAWKGRMGNDEVADGAAAAVELGLEFEATAEVSERLEARDRVLVVFRKATPTPARFPRRPGMATKRPLRA